MNAIGAGKQEKVAGSIIIETVRDLPMITGAGQVISITADEYNSGNYYLYFLDYYNHVMLINLRSLMPDSYNSTTYRVYMQNNSAQWRYISFLYDYIGDRRITFNIQNYEAMSTILTKFAIVKIP